MGYACSLEQFQKDTATHEMEVLLDNGVYRHLKFRRPGTSCYGFDIITWPGHLAISGDMGASVFSRLADMFEFFRNGPKWREENPGKLGINVPYWAEKLVANDGDAKRYSQEMFVAALKERFEAHFEGEELSQHDASIKEHLWERIVRLAACDTHESAVRWADSFDPEFVTVKQLPALHASLRFPDFWEATVTEYSFHLVWRMYAIAHAVQVYDDLKATASPAVAEAES